MTLVQAVNTCLRKKYLTFSGRAARSEFWKFILFIFLGVVACLILNSLLFGPEVKYRIPVDENGTQTGEPQQLVQYTTGILGNIFGFAVLLPWLAVTWRRMHDSGMRGFWPFVTFLMWILLIFLVIVVHLGPSEFASQFSETGQATTPVSPLLILVILLLFVGCIILNTYWLAHPSDPNTNKFGPNPNEVPS